MAESSRYKRGQQLSQWRKAGLVPTLDMHRCTLCGRHRAAIQPLFALPTLIPNRTDLSQEATSEAEGSDCCCCSVPAALCWLLQVLHVHLLPLQRKGLLRKPAFVCQVGTCRETCWTPLRGEQGCSNEAVAPGNAAIHFPMPSCSGSLSLCFLLFPRGR